jgi:hypothetical protein
MKKTGAIGACDKLGEKRNTYILVGKPQEKGPIGRLKNSW